MSSEEYDDHHAGHLGYILYLNGLVLANLNLHIGPIPPTKFQFNLTHGFGGDVDYFFFLDGCHLGYQNEAILSILSLHTYCHNTSHKVSVQSNTRFLVEMSIKEF